MSNIPTAAAVGAFGEMSVQDCISLAKRRKFWIIFPALAVMTAIAVVAWRLPNIFRSEAVILIEPQKVPYSFVQPTTMSGWGERLSTIYQEVTSPARLKRVIDSLGLYPELRKQEGEQEAVSTMQKSISVEQVSVMGSQAAAFRISYKGRDPAKTAQVTNQIAAMFIEENLKVREEQSYGTADFLDGELQKTAQELQEKANELAELRSQYGQDLPEAGQFHVQEAEALRQQLHTAEQQITQDQQQKVDLQSLEESTVPTVDVDLYAGISSNESEPEALQTKLNALRSRYGPNHPDVRKLQAQLDKAKAKQAETPAPKTATPVARKRNNPVIEAELEQLDQDIEKQKKVVAQLQPEINFHLSKMQNIPAFQQKSAAIQRDYDALQARYRSLLDKKMSAQTATDMESREKSERFVMLDSARVPERPYSPDRPLFVIGGTFLGILVGIGVAFLREMVDDSVRNEREAERILGAPVLTGVPEILTVQQLWYNTLRLGSVAVVTVVVAVGLGIGIAHFGVRFL